MLLAYHHQLGALVTVARMVNTYTESFAVKKYHYSFNITIDPSWQLYSHPFVYKVSSWCQSSHH